MSTKVAARVQIVLKPGRDKALRQGHPWLFSGAIAEENGPATAALATVRAADGREIGTGLYSRRSQIRVRLLHHGPAPPVIDRSFFARRLVTALRLRAAVVPAETTGMRLINAEGDGLPAWTVDRYGDVLVSQITCAGLEQLATEAFVALTQAVPEATTILAANHVRARRREGLEHSDRWRAGAPCENASFTECGLRFSAELGGQKTGFYLDQRENRRRAAELARGRTVLDLFAHTGAFSAHALRAGAERVVAVESSPRLIARGSQDLATNGLAIERMTWTRANVFEDLRERQERYGLVICDPPSLVEKRSDQRSGARAYKDLNRLAFNRVEDGGFLLTFSCSGGIDNKLFRQILFAAADEAGVEASLLTPLAAAPDHPVAITHPQGEYLKGWLIYVWGSRDRSWSGHTKVLRANADPRVSGR